jgi:hypothetical protein
MNHIHTLDLEINEYWLYFQLDYSLPLQRDLDKLSRLAWKYGKALNTYQIRTRCISMKKSRVRMSEASQRRNLESEYKLIRKDESKSSWEKDLRMWKLNKGYLKSSEENDAHELLPALVSSSNLILIKSTHLLFLHYDRKLIRF